MRVVPGVEGATEESLFEVGSLAKPMTGILLAVLVCDGYVRLSDPVERFIGMGPNRAITLGELATHTAGLPRLPPSAMSIQPGGAATDGPYSQVNRSSLLADLGSLSLVRRGCPQYSNFGFMLLGMVLERAAGRSFGRLLEERVLTPLGIAESVRYAGLSEVAVPNLLRGFRGGVEAPLWRRQVFGSGGLLMTIVAATGALSAMADPDQSGLRDALLLAQEVHVWSGSSNGYGLGWVWHRGSLVHSGASGGFRAALAVVPSQRSGVVALMNEYAGGEDLNRCCLESIVGD